jgi:hypothetical protein
MNLSTSTLAADNVVEVLEKIVEFTSRRHSILTDNILNVNTNGFIPMDVNVEGFAGVIAEGLTEYIKSERLLLHDIQNVTFGVNGSFDTPPAVDHEAIELFHTDLKEYLRFEIRKYSENLLNNKIGLELLRQRQQLNQN